MKKLFLVAIAIVAMAEISNAQSTLCRDVACTCDSGIRTGPGSCDLVANNAGACDSNSMCVNLQNDLANCGSLRHACDVGSDCVDGACIADGGGDFGGIQPGANPANPPLAIDAPQILTKRKRPHLS